MDKWCVYFIRCGVKMKDPVKIGRTTDISVRMKDLQVGNPYELNLLFTLPCVSLKHSMKLERFLHRQLYNTNHIRGEWFLIDDKVNIPKLLEKFNTSHSHLFGVKVIKDSSDK